MSSADRDAIANTRMDSLVAQNGPIQFTDTGENKGATPIVMQVVKGEVKQVFPESAAQAKPVYPASPGR